jgi:hypothetical protein
MIPERIAQIEATLHSSANIPEATRRELLELLASLKTEVAALGESAPRLDENAVLPGGGSPGEAAQVAEGLAASVRDFEVSHPRLVQIVDRLALTLSNMGI